MVQNMPQNGCLDAKALYNCLAKIACGFWFVSSLPAFAGADAGRIASICEVAAREAAERYGIPVEVMQALTLTETGRMLEGRKRPWPWSLNVEGRGHWFNTKTEAIEYLQEKIPKSSRSYDLGCFQINARWHGEAFASEVDMFDPHLNADYAARFLLSLLPEFGSWERAAGAYHSRTPKYARRYEQLFNANLESLGDSFESYIAKPQQAPVHVPYSLLGQPESWTDEAARPGSLARLRNNPAQHGLLRQAGRRLY